LNDGSVIVGLSGSLLSVFGAGFGRRKTISLIAPLLGSMLRPIVSPSFSDPDAFRFGGSFGLP